MQLCGNSLTHIYIMYYIRDVCIICHSYTQYSLGFKSGIPQIKLHSNFLVLLINQLTELLFNFQSVYT